jgi:serine/threonine-protein kinase RsbW
MHCCSRNNNNRVPLFALALAENTKKVRVNSLSDMEPVFDILETWMRFLGYPRKDLFAVALAVHEAAANAFHHGNHGDLTKSIQVCYLVTSSEVLVEVQDEGSGFDLSTVPDPISEGRWDRPSGRGIFLMKAYSSWVSFSPKGNSVLLCRKRSEP